MVTYGKYNGNLLIVLRQDKNGFFVLDVYNQSKQRFRFNTLVDEQIFSKEIISTSLNDEPEKLINTLLDNVVSGTHKKHFWVFSKKIPDNLLTSYVKLVKEKYRG